MAEMEIRSEQIDDIPLLSRQMEEMSIPAVLDVVIEVHGTAAG